MAESVLERRLGMKEATALNVLNMIGVGPFITLPLLFTALGGPQALLGWLFAFVVTAADGLVWSELGARYPESGGTYAYLREAYGSRWGRLASFLFIWQFVFSGPLEIASGYIGFVSYLGYVWPDKSPIQNAVVIVSLGLLNVFLLFRGIGQIGRITLILSVGVIATIAIVLFLGVLGFDPKLAFDLPEGAFTPSLAFLLGLGAASRIGVYDYLGYYSVCYVAAEVRQPERVLPRSILGSLVFVALVYVGLSLAVSGSVSWREFVPASETRSVSDFVVSVFVERTAGKTAAQIFTALILWTTFGSVFVLLLGYSRIPFAAARDGVFFAPFAKLHAVRGCPSVSLVVLGLIAIAAAFFPLDAVIGALLTTRILAQFLAQIGAVVLVRRRGGAIPFRMWLYPVPCVVAALGWAFLFATTGFDVLLSGVMALVLGLVAFLGWSWRAGAWPFGQSRHS
ncbi:MAG: APC family permease [Deltaproteobacteria bacterium]|nr:APC family permease [Deltaproteobacteria bacterium]